MIRINHWNDIPQIDVMRLYMPAHVFTIEAIIDDKPLYHDIKNFLQRQEYPLGASKKDRKTLRKLTGRFFLNEDVLYKRNFDMVLLRCVNRKEAETLMREIHEGSFGTHTNGHTMTRKSRILLADDGVRLLPVCKEVSQMSDLRR